MAKQYNADYVLFNSNCQGNFETANNKPIAQSGQYYIEKVNYHLTE